MWNISIFILLLPVLFSSHGIVCILGVSIQVVCLLFFVFLLAVNFGIATLNSLTAVCCRMDGWN